MHFKLFDKAVYIKRRAALKKSIGSGIILFMGNEESSMNYKDNWYTFRQDSSFLYYFGLDVAGLAAMIDVDSGEEMIFGNELTIDEIVWTGPLPSVTDMAAAVGVDATAPSTKIGQWIQQARDKKQTVHILPPYRPENRIKLAAWLSISVSQVNELVSIELIKAIIRQRLIKEPIEIEEIEKAVSISADMHRIAMQYTQPGMKEYEVAAKVQEVAMAANGRLSYPVICTINGQILHNHYHGNTLKEGQMLLLDAGAENDMHYAGDLTRTFPVSKQFSTQQREIYDIVLAAMEHAIGLLKPGILFKEVHAKACEKLLEGLKTVQLVKGDPAEAVAAGVHTLFFQCGLGHLMGLDVHDMEDLGEQYTGYTDTLKKSTEFGWKSLRLARALEPDFVLTVEPGVYIIPELIDQWKAIKKHEAFINYEVLEKYRNFGGIRIEDNYAITDTGSRRLGKFLPVTAKEIEAFRG
jgi:Xaa-Pro aminopeptidase